jgi:adenylate kinase
MRNVIFLGAPGCGKGTQSKIISSQIGCKKLSTGDLLREIVKENTALSKDIHNTLTKGNLVSDEMVNQMIDDFYRNIEANDCVVLDGYPRSIEQAKALDRILEKYDAKVDEVFYFEMPDENLVKRITGRYTCNNCGKIYNKFFYATSIEGVCDECGSNDFNKRSDDSEEVVINRLEIFKRSTEPLLEYYANKLININAEQTTQLVSEQIKQCLLEK